MGSPFEKLEWNAGTVGLLLVGLFLAVWLLLGYAHFGDLIGIGFVYAGAIGLICAVCAGGTRPTFCDSANIRNHWRGHLQAAATVSAIGLIGTVITAVL